MMVTKSKIPVWRLAGFALQRGGCYRIDLPDIGYANLFITGQRSTVDYSTHFNIPVYTIHIY